MSPLCVGDVPEPARWPHASTHGTARALYDKAEWEGDGWAAQGRQEGKERASERGERGEMQWAGRTMGMGEETINAQKAAEL